MINNSFSRILVTGSSGFIGQQVIENVKNHTFSTLSLRGVHLCDIKMTDIDVVLHLAGKAHDLKNISSENEYYEINYELTKQLFDKFLQSDAEKFILTALRKTGL